MFIVIVPGICSDPVVSDTTLDYDSEGSAHRITVLPGYVKNQSM
jgi:hypothetical protein